MRYRDNTVKGTRRGSKWPEAVKTACMCDLLTDNNLSVVARRHGVPESTPLRRSLVDRTSYS